ncbi:unnamed protein product [Spirodela intermedia]|uniref:U-box domain-containing protein n=1 Tax=Spirodela intermedia TaxID=51605 RepID=A0A7I8IB73_SPIIN|nr:unnamed protein product [Spirodela intermedia]CAA6654965.1 unnamed protein product [Spirodela intermedia]
MARPHAGDYAGPGLAADGHTYEDAALRGWLHGGRETSPMTNLKLDNLELTPNHASALQSRTGSATQVSRREKQLLVRASTPPSPLA